MNTEKIKEKSLSELIELKNCINEIVFRTRITDKPTPQWNSFNNLLGAINREIEKRIYDEFYN